MDVHHLVKYQPNPKVPDIRPGDTIRVNFTIREGERVRNQAFQGVVILKRGGSTPAASFTVRRISHNNIGVERVFPYFSPFLDSVEVIRRGKVRRARLYYLRGRFGRAARIKEKPLQPGERRGGVSIALSEEILQEAQLFSEEEVEEAAPVAEAEAAPVAEAEAAPGTQKEEERTS